MLLRAGCDVLMTPRAEELWSYMSGLAPLGEPVFLVREWLEEDLGMRNKFAVCNWTKELESAGVISRFAPRTFAVVRRPGASA